MRNATTLSGSKDIQLVLVHRMASRILYPSDQLVPRTVLLQRRRWSRNRWWRLEQTGEKSPLNGRAATCLTKETGVLAGMATSDDGWLDLFVVAGGGDVCTEWHFLRIKRLPQMMMVHDGSCLHSQSFLTVSVSCCTYTTSRNPHSRARATFCGVCRPIQCQVWRERAHEGRETRTNGPGRNCCPARPSSGVQE
jgi:hypothetical protein